MMRLSEQEEDIMRAFWAYGKGSVKDILQQLPPPQPPYTTIASAIKKLEKNGLLNSQLVGNTYLYSPVMGENDYKKRFIQGVVNNYFENSYKNLVSFFAAEKQLTPEELRELAALIEHKNKNKN
jgi:BlaI family penicillinase repressor